MLPTPWALAASSLLPSCPPFACVSLGLVWATGARMHCSLNPSCHLERDQCGPSRVARARKRFILTIPGPASSTRHAWRCSHIHSTRTRTRQGSRSRMAAFLMRFSWPCALQDKRRQDPLLSRRHGCARAMLTWKRFPHRGLARTIRRSVCS